MGQFHTKPPFIPMNFRGPEGYFKHPPSRWHCSWSEPYSDAGRKRCSRPPLPSSRPPLALLSIVAFCRATGPSQSRIARSTVIEYRRASAPSLCLGMKHTATVRTTRHRRRWLDVMEPPESFAEILSLCSAVSGFPWPSSTIAVTPERAAQED